MTGDSENYWRIRGYCHSVKVKPNPIGKGYIYTLMVGYAEDELFTVIAHRSGQSDRLEALAGSGWLLEVEGQFRFYSPTPDMVMADYEVLG